MLRNIQMSPKKLGLWAKMVRRLHVEDAMIQCTIRINKGAKILARVRQHVPFAGDCLCSTLRRRCAYLYIQT